MSNSQFKQPHGGITHNMVPLDCFDSLGSFIFVYKRNLVCTDSV